MAWSCSAHHSHSAAALGSPDSSASAFGQSSMTAPSLPADPASLEAFIDAGAAMNALTVEPAYRAGVKIHLTAVTNAAKLVLAFEVEDDAEPGPVFRP